MSKKKKNNSGKKPNANEGQLRAAARLGMDKTMVYALTALADKMGFTNDQLLEFIGHVGYTADSVKRTRVSYEDLRTVLIEERGLEWGKM